MPAAGFGSQTLSGTSRTRPPNPHTQPGYGSQKAELNLPDASTRPSHGNPASAAKR